MSYAAHLRNIKSAIEDLQSGREAETTKIMADDVALIKRRVINEGKLSDGSPTEGYSEAVVPYWFHGSSEYTKKNAAFNVGNKQKEGLKKFGYFFSYKQWRELNGRPTGFKNFSMTGNMWKKISAILFSIGKYSTTYVVGSEDQEVQKIIDYNSARSGPFLDQSNDEKELISKLNRERVLNVMKKHNLA